MLNRYRTHASALAILAGLAMPDALHAQPAQPQPSGQSGQTPATRPAPPAAGTGQNVVVTGTRSDVISTPDRTSFSVANDLAVQTGTLADALRAVPGVDVDVQGNVSLRGDPGVVILVDGRPSAMLRGDGRADAILSMPANSIERVEIITNPSADQSPEGTGGVINLVTRRARANSQSGTIRVNYGGEQRGSVSLNGSISRPGLTITGDVAYRRFNAEGESVQERSRLNPLTGTFIDSRQDSEFESVSAFGTGRLGIDYDLNPQNRLSTELSYREGANNLDRFDRFLGQNAATSYGRVSDNNFSQRGMTGRLSWRRSMGTDHELVTDFQADNIRLRRNVEALSTFDNGTRVAERVGNAVDRQDYTVKVDYRRPTGRDQSLHVGYQGDFRSNEFAAFGSFGPTFDTLVVSPNLTSAFGFDETIQAIFGTYRFKLGKLDVQAGLRLEQVDTVVTQPSLGTSFERDYFRAYPTLHLNYQLTEAQALRASYSRRVQRPNLTDFDPNLFFVDPQTRRRGNPFLLPEVTDSFELGWQYRKSGTFYSLTGFYRRSSDGVTDIISDLGGGIFLLTRANLATSERYGVEAVANGRLSRTLTYNASGSLYRHEIDPQIGGVSTPRGLTTGSVRGTLSWQLTPKDFLQLTGNWSGRQLLPQGYRESGAVLNFGYRRRVDERLSLLLSIQDVFETASNEIVFETPTLRDRVQQDGIGRIVFIGLAYNFGGTSNRRPQEPGFDFQAPSTPE